MQLLSQSRRRIATLLTEIIVNLLTALLRISINLKTDKALLLGPEHSKKPMRSHTLQRFRILEITIIFHSIRTYSLLCSLGHHSSCLENLSESLSYRSCLTQPLCNDITRTRKSRIHILHLIIHKSGSLTHRITNCHRIHLISQGLKPGLLRNSSPGAPLRLIRQINILKFTRLDAIDNLVTQLRSQSPSSLNRLHNGSFSFLHLREHISPMADLSHGHLIEATGTLLPVTADKRYSSPVIKQRDTILHLPVLDLQTLSNIAYIEFFHYLIV